MRRAPICVSSFVLLSSCELFGFTDYDDFPYRRELLWRTSSLSSVGVPDVDALSVYALSADRALYAVDRRTGTVRWSVPTQQTGFASGVARIGSVVVSAAGTLVAFDTDSRAKIWQSTFTDRLGELPVATSGTVLFPASFASSDGAAFALLGDQQIVWRSVITPPDSALKSGDFVRAFTPEILNSSVVYSFSWFRSGQSVSSAGVAVVDANSGVRRWSRMLPMVNQTVTTAPSDAVTDGTRVYLTVRDGRVLALSIDDGALVWTAASVTSSADGRTGDIRPLTIVDQTVVVGSGSSTLTGYDARSGEPRWQADTKNGGTAQVFRFRSNMVLLLHYDGEMSLREAYTGRLLWLADPGKKELRVNGIRVAGDTVFATSNGRGLQSFILHPR